MPHETVTGTTHQPAPRTHPLKPAMASLIGTAIEWYDYFLYGLAAGVVFGPLFFSPELSSTAATLAAFATYAVGFVARPLGGIVMGHFGDIIGRKAMLITSLLGMGSVTVLIGLLPTYASIGLWAPILLVTLRFVQGLAVGGEWGGAVLMAVEHAPEDKKSFYGSFPQMGVPAGFFLANAAVLGVTATFGAAAFVEWAWRIPFLLSGVLVIVGLVMRSKLEESPDFAELPDREHESMPLVVVLRDHSRSVALVAAGFIGATAVAYIFMAFLLSYTTRTLGMVQNHISIIMLIAAVVWFVATPYFAGLVDRIGRVRVLVPGSVALIGAGAVLLPAARTENVVILGAALVFVSIVLAAVYGPMAALFSSLFPTEVRYSGSSLGYQIGAILGGIAPLTATALLGWSGGAIWPVCVYLAVASAISLVALLVLVRGRNDTSTAAAAGAHR